MILQTDGSNRPRTAFRRWTQAVRQVAAIQVGRHRFLACLYRFLAAKRQKREQIFPRAVRTTELPSNPAPLTFRNNQIQILRTSSTHATMAANVFQQDTNKHGTRLSHARTRQSFFDTTHQKWSEWKTNRSAVITGLFRRKRQGWGGSLKPSDLKMEKIDKKNCFLQNRPAIICYFLQVLIL